ncbi:MAG: RluA family pseudouridine synthase [Ruminococcaceae bacterium]|nr:RluA family pseudouridine synthase [Oscillospiraceae bacterium]
MRLSYLVQPADDGQRAVDVLVRQTGMSRLLTKKVRLYGSLLCNGQPHRMIDLVRSGDQLVARYEPDGSGPPPLRTVEGIKVRYQDDWVLVVSKPADLVTHPSYLHDEDALTALLSDRPLHPVNRLDRDTSGLVLLALNGHAHHVISSRPQSKHYLALLHGRLPAARGMVQAPMRRAAGSIMLREVHENGLQARTLWQEYRYFAYSDVSLVGFQLLTGRTHQIRVHCQACGCPIVGDSLYGSKAAPDVLDQLIGRQALHAVRLVFYHPVTGKQETVTAPLESDFQRLLTFIRRRETQC